MKLQKIVSRLQELHPKEIDLSLDRIQDLCKRLGNPQDKIKAISIVGTNGKYSTIQAMFAILKEANIKCNIYTSPHIKSINERFVFNNQELNDEELANLFEEIESANNNEPITFFEILTAAYFLKASQYPDNINLIETGLFHRFDATNILKDNLASIVTSIGLDHLDWLPENEKTVEKIIYEKTSTLLNSDIIVANSNAGLEAYRVPEKKRSCIHNGFDFNRIKTINDEEKTREHYLIKPGKLVGMVGAFFDRKDYETVKVNKDYQFKM